MDGEGVRGGPNVDRGSGASAAGGPGGGDTIAAVELVAPLWEEVAVAPIPRLLPKVSVVLLPRGMRVVVLLPLGVGAVLLLLPVVVVLVVLPAELPPL